MTYYTKARLFPTILTSIPLLVLFNIVVTPLYYSELKNIDEQLPLITDTILSSAIVFLLVQLNRLVSKEVFQRMYFVDEIKMPTTSFLLNSDTNLEESIKKLIIDKIKTDFNISLLTTAEENNDEIRARKIILSAVSQIRNHLRDNKILFQHNIEYGFVRNLLGGSLIALFISVIMIVILCYNQRPVNVWITFASVYLWPVLFSKFLIKLYGKYYAKVLFEQYLFK